MNTRTKFRFALISSASAIFVPAAHAQVATPSSPAPPKSAASTSQSTNDGIADIVVTARKRAENLRDVPISITAVQGQALTDSKIVQVSDLAARVPNLTIASAGNLPFTLIRGFGSGNNLSFVVREQCILPNPL
jgi:iron complex outermembrane receptor protein